MTRPRDRLARLLAPYDYDRFMADIVGKAPLVLAGDGRIDRAGLIGPDPEATILAAFADHSARLTSHAEGATAPPPVPHAVTSPEAYRALVQSYHDGGHTVRIPDAGRLSDELQALLRALHALTGNPAEVVVFWSAPGNAAPVHYDEVDVLAIQLAGTKRWFLSNEPASLVGRTRPAAEPPSVMGDHQVVDVAPGDLLYLPRGTIHTVQSTGPSIHLSIGFMPLTVRDALVALVDHLADLDRSVRENALARADADADGPPTADLSAHLARLAEAARDPRIVAIALDRHRARTIRALDRLPRGDDGAIALDTPLERHPFALQSLVVTDRSLDFTQPGDSILVHPGTEQAMRFIPAADRVIPADLPGGLGDDIKLALVRRLVASGYLVPALEP